MDVTPCESPCFLERDRRGCVDMENTRLEFIKSAAATVALPAAFGTGCSTVPQAQATAEDENAVLDLWQAETDLATSELYAKYWRDGDTRGLVSLDKLDAAFEKVMQEAKETVATDSKPAVWSIYNMGYIDKTPKRVTISLVIRFIL